MDQNYKPLEIEDKINDTLVINESVKYKTWRTVKPGDQILVKGYGFLTFAESMRKDVGRNVK